MNSNFNGFNGFNLHITLTMALAYLSDIVARFPDKGFFQDEGCRYFDVEGDRLVPVCIIGQMFADLGILRTLAADHENFVRQNSDNCSYAGSLWNKLEPFGITADEDAVNFMRSVQSGQDSGLSWSTAFQRAVTEHHDRAVSNLPTSRYL